MIRKVTIIRPSNILVLVECIRKKKLISLPFLIFFNFTALSNIFQFLEDQGSKELPVLREVYI